MWEVTKFAVSVTTDEFEELWNTSKTLPPKRNPNDTANPLKLKEINFGTNIQKPFRWTSDYPSLVKKVINYVDNESYNNVRAIFYEGDYTAKPINGNGFKYYKFIFISDPAILVNFQCINKHSRKIINNLQVGNGDLITYFGRTQKRMNQASISKKNEGLRKIELILTTNF
jgi:hypothetical protein